MKVDQVFVAHVALLPEVSRKVAARLERARAVLVEQGRLDAAQLAASPRWWPKRSRSTR